MSWYQTQTIERTAFLRIHGEIVGPKTANDLIAELEDPTSINCRIDECHGGNCEDALTLYDFLRRRETRVKITGRASSAGAIIACAGRHVTMAENALLMVHAPAACVMGNSSELMARAELLAPVAQRFEDILRERSRQPKEIVQQWLSTDTYFTPAQALAVGLVDEISPAESSSPTAFAADVAPRNATDEFAQQRLFLDFLRAFGRLTVPSKAKFGRELSQWFVMNVREEPQPAADPISTLVTTNQAPALCSPCGDVGAQRAPIPLSGQKPDC